MNAGMQAPDEAPQDSRASNSVAAICIGIVAFLPIAIGWMLPHLYASRVSLWTRSKRRKRTAWLLAIVLAMAGAYLAVQLVAYAESIPFWTLTGLLLVGLWACLAPFALIAWNMRKGRIAHQVATLVFDPNKLQVVEQAIWKGSIKSLDVRRETVYPFAQDTHGHRRSIIGVAPEIDRRSSFHKMRTAPRSTMVDQALGLLPISLASRLLPSQCASWECGQRVVLPEQASSAIVLGGTGSGKTILICAMIAAAIRQGGSIVYFNGKGDQETRDLVEVIAKAQGVELRHWTTSGMTPFDGWRGTYDDIVTKLLKMLGTPTSDASSYYTSITRAVLQKLATRRQNAGIEPWSSAQEFTEDLANGRGLGYSGATLERVRMDVERALAGIETSTSGRSDPNGWCWEDAERTSITLIDVPPHSDPAQMAATLMLCDLLGYKEARRNPHVCPLTVIIDEAQVLLTSDVVPPFDILIEQVRSAGIGVILATQSLAGLGPEPMPQRLLDSGVPILSGFMRSGEEISNRAGTYTRGETGHQGIEGVPTGVTTSRAQHGFKVSPQRLRELPTGCFYLITKGHDPRMFQALPPESFAAFALSPLMRPGLTPT